MKTLISIICLFLSLSASADGIRVFECTMGEGRYNDTGSPGAIFTKEPIEVQFVFDSTGVTVKYRNHEDIGVGDTWKSTAQLKFHQLMSEGDQTFHIIIMLARNYKEAIYIEQLNFDRSNNSMLLTRTIQLKSAVDPKLQKKAGYTRIVTQRGECKENQW